MFKVILKVLIIYVIINTSLFAVPLIKEDKLNIAMILWRGETKAEVGFKSKLKSLGYDVKFTLLNANNKRFEFPTLLRNMNFEEFDYIYTFGTTATKLTKYLVNNEVPHIFNIVSSPVEAGIVDSITSSGSDISGVSNKISVKTQINNALNIIKFKKLAVFSNPREENSIIVVSSLVELGKKLGFEIIPLYAPTLKILKRHLSDLENKNIIADAVYLPTDSFIVSNSKLIASVLNKLKIKSIGSIRDYIDNGIMMGTVVDYYKLGEKAALILHQHKNGQKLKNISIQFPDNVKVVINKKTYKLMNFKIGDEFLNNINFE